MSRDNQNNQEEKPGKMKNKEFEQELEKLQVELVKLQQWVVHEGLRVIIVFEGRDAAGKGGTIKCIVDRVSPRVFRVVALPTPNARKRSCTCNAIWPIFQRRAKSSFSTAVGYNRAGVERVMGDEMFAATDTPASPWYVIHSDDKSERV